MSRNANILLISLLWTQGIDHYRFLYNEFFTSNTVVMETLGILNLAIFKLANLKSHVVFVLASPLKSEIYLTINLSVSALPACLLVTR